MASVGTRCGHLQYLAERKRKMARHSRKLGFGDARCGSFDAHLSDHFREHGDEPVELPGTCIVIYPIYPIFTVTYLMQNWWFSQ